MLLLLLHFRLFPMLTGVFFQILIAEWGEKTHLSLLTFSKPSVFLAQLAAVAAPDPGEVELQRLKHRHDCLLLWRDDWLDGFSIEAGLLWVCDLSVDGNERRPEIVDSVSTWPSDLFFPNNVQEPLERICDFDIMLYCTGRLQRFKAQREPFICSLVFCEMLETLFKCFKKQMVKARCSRHCRFLPRVWK